MDALTEILLCCVAGLATAAAAAVGACWAMARRRAEEEQVARWRELLKLRQCRAAADQLSKAIDGLADYRDRPIA